MVSTALEVRGQPAGLDRKHVIAAGLLTALVISGGLAAYEASMVTLESGRPVYGSSVPLGLPDAVKLSMETYNHMIDLCTASFGALAFLVMFQRDRSVGLRVWALLAVAFVCLLGALFFTIVGRETLLLMIGRNAVDLGASAFAYGRIGQYTCLLAAAGALGLFALDVASATPLGGTQTPEAS